MYILSLARSEHQSSIQNHRLSRWFWIEQANQQKNAPASCYKENGESALKDHRGRHKKDYIPRTEEERLKLEVATLKRQLYLAQMENDVLSMIQLPLAKIECDIKRFLSETDDA